MCVPKFRSVGLTVQPVERKRTESHIDATENITSSINVGGKKVNSFVLIAPILRNYFIII